LIFLVVFIFFILFYEAQVSASILISLGLLLRVHGAPCPEKGSQLVNTRSTTVGVGVGYAIQQLPLASATCTHLLP
jgi:hypothetical protein